MEILFSQGPTAHSRLANSLLWMARAFPILREFPEYRFLFPWGREALSDYLNPLSPWLVEPAPRVSQLFTVASGRELSASELSRFSRELEYAYESRHNLEPYGWNQLMFRAEIRDVSLAYCAGVDCDFNTILEQACGVDLLIVHEPFQIKFQGPRFPCQGLEHLAPAAVLADDSRRYMAAINPQGSSICAVHIRRGDYAVWEGGKFFYQDQFWMELCDQLMADGFRVCVFTNEQNSTLGKSLVRRGAHLSRGSASQDFCRMLHVDRVIGPPSTFPLMARSVAKACLGREIVYESLAPLAISQ